MAPDHLVVAVQRHLALGAVAVVGAGLSIDARFPLTTGLNTLLWDALDADPPARMSVATTLLRPDGPAKQLVGDTWSDILVAWSVVESNAPARDRFQGQFSRLDSERSSHPSPAHDALARLVHAGVVECVVSLNWDTALERAYQRLYGVPLPAGVLLKPHGDAAEPGSPWVLPHQPGRVPTQVSEVVNRLAKAHARTLLIVGYSERDQVVVQDLIEPLDHTWRTVRIGPTANGADDVPAGAELVLPQLARPYVDREGAAAWHTVNYQGRRDVVAALRGERLGPRDVDTCPQLAEVDWLASALQTDRAVVMNGPPGCGKSITAYQALRGLAGSGFETLRLRDGARTQSLHSWIEDLRTFPHPKVLFVDDAQDLSPDTVRELTEHADAGTLVLIAGIDHVAGGVRTIRLGAGAAVARLAQWVRDGRTSLFPLIRELDEQVGSYPRDLFFDRRIDAAEREETPWRFFYTLTGGWRRIARDARQLRDSNRADLALLAVAVAQIAGVDAGVDRAQLTVLAAKLGHDSAWLDVSLHELGTRRLILTSDGRFRCAHLQAAYAMLAWMLHPQAWSDPPLSSRPTIPQIASAVPAVQPHVDPPPTRSPRSLDLSPAEIRADQEAACSLVTLMLDAKETPLRGLSWLADGGSFAGARELLYWKGVLGPERDKQLASRALATPTGNDITTAVQLLSEVVGRSRGGEVLEIVKKNEQRVRDWFAYLAPENAWAFGNLVNSLYQPDSEYAAQVAAYADSSSLASVIIDGGWPESNSTGYAVDRICFVGGDPVQESFRRYLNNDAYRDMFDDRRAEFWRAVGLIANLLTADHELALHLFERSASQLAIQFATDPVGQWNDMIDLVFRLGYGPQFLRARKGTPPPEVQRAVKAFTRALDKNRIADTLASQKDRWGQVNFQDFILLLSEVDPAVLQEIVMLVDMTKFEESLSASAHDPDTSTLCIISFLQEAHPDEVHDVLDRLEPRLVKLDSYFAYIAPDLAARALRRGLPLDLGLDHQQWLFAAAVLARLTEYDHQIGVEVARANAESMAIGLAAKNVHDPWENLRNWTAACDRAAPGLLDEVIAGLPEGAVASWDRALRRPPKGLASRRKDIAPLVQRAARLNGHIQTEALDVIRRFPTASSIVRAEKDV